MSRLRKMTSSILFVSFIATGLWGCGLNGDNASPQDGARTQNINPPVDFSTNKASAGVVVRNDLSTKLNKMAGIRNATVLQDNGNLYVGFVNMGKEKFQDEWMRERNGKNWTGMPYGTENNPKSAKGMTLEQLQNEKLPNASSLNGPGATVPGNVSPETKKRIADALRASTPDVRDIYLSATLDDMRQLGGYRHFIVQGGNFAPHVGEMRTFVQEHLIRVDQ